MMLGWDRKKALGTMTKKGKGAKSVGQPKTKIRCKLNGIKGV